MAYVRNMHGPSTAVLGAACTSKPLDRDRQAGYAAGACPLPLGSRVPLRLFTGAPPSHRKRTLCRRLHFFSLSDHLSRSILPRKGILQQVPPSGRSICSGGKSSASLPTFPRLERLADTEFHVAAFIEDTSPSSKAPSWAYPPSQPRAEYVVTIYHCSGGEPKLTVGAPDSDSSPHPLPKVDLLRRPHFHSLV